MYTISKEFSFSASHQLGGLPRGHQCSRLHGHNYVVRVELSTHLLDETGFVLDYGELAPMKDFIDRRLDHRHLNDEMADNPTAENLARFLALAFRRDVPLARNLDLAVSVSETQKTWATYREPARR